MQQLQLQMTICQFLPKNCAFPVAYLNQDKDQVNLISLTIDHQKNSCRGEIFLHHTIEGMCIGYSISCIMEHGQKPSFVYCANPPLYHGSIFIAMTFWWPWSKPFHSQESILPIMIQNKLAHALCAGGTIALYDINKHDALTIQCASQWTSNTFLEEYIHSQLDASSHDLAQSMSKVPLFWLWHNFPVLPVGWFWFSAHFSRSFIKFDITNQTPSAFNSKCHICTCLPIDPLVWHGH